MGGKWGVSVRGPLFREGWWDSFLACSFVAMARSAAFVVPVVVPAGVAVVVIAFSGLKVVRREEREEVDDDVVLVLMLWVVSHSRLDLGDLSGLAAAVAAVVGEGVLVSGRVSLVAPGYQDFHKDIFIFSVCCWCMSFGRISVFY